MKYTESAIPEKYRLKVYHYRDCPQDVKWTTIAEIYDGNSCVAHGIAKCSSKDNPSRKIGRAISVGRAVKGLRQKLATEKQLPPGVET